jgi:hypothetical protein
MTHLNEENWYEAVMESREDALRERFGPTSPPDKVIKSEDESWEMTIPGFAFLRYPATESRPYWLYVTHGLSQPQSYVDACNPDDTSLSGYGMEFAIATPGEENWPIQLLDSLSAYALSGQRPVLVHERIPSSDLMEEATGGAVLMMGDPGYDNRLQILSGEFRITHMVGITAGEYRKAKGYKGTVGSKILEEVLRELGIGCVTDRKRACLTRRPEFAESWARHEKSPS